MIRNFNTADINEIIRIWLDTNIRSHYFISKNYWLSNYESVKNILPESEVYVYEDDDSHKITGFIGLTDNYIEGIFVKSNYQSKGIGKQLLNHVKSVKAALTLRVYQKNERAVKFYQREHFHIRSESVDENTDEKEFTMEWNK